ncbi:uncharacterized protein LOC144158492 isoform X1 [Haemaphysalis longicornis]
MLCGTSLMPEGNVVALSAVAAQSWDVSCSRRTQATIPTTSSIGTQCCLRLRTSTSSQTEEEFLVLDLENYQSADVGKFPASQGGTDIGANAGPHTFSCQPHFGNTGSFLSNNGEAEITGEQYSCLPREQCNHQSTHRKACSSSSSLICPVCKQVFHRKHALGIHMRVHSDEKPYMCSICQKSFKQRSNLYTHERLHSGERPYACSLCQKTFTKKSTLVDHERVHSGERPHVCCLCQKTFTKRCHLTAHERVHSGERPYVCSLCQKTFTNKSTLVTHGRVHSGERPYICGICQKSFNQKATLIRHERSHSGDSPHMCDICEQSFATSSHLVKHQRLHSDERSLESVNRSLLEKTT